jgi:hypothetical protein
MRPPAASAASSGVPEDGPPEAQVDRLGVRRDRELGLLGTASIRGGSMLAHDD